MSDRGFAYNDAHDPNRGRAGYTQAEDGSWVGGGFYDPTKDSTPYPTALTASEDLSWLLATGAVRGQPPPIAGAQLVTGVAGVRSGTLIPVTFAGGTTLNLPWVGVHPGDGSTCLVAKFDQTWVVVGEFVPVYPFEGMSEAEVTALTARVATLENFGTMYVENVAAGIHFYWTGGVVSKTADASGNCSINFGEPGTPFSYPTAAVTAWCQGASGGAPIAVNVGAVNLGSLDLHLSGLEGTVVPHNSFSLIYGVLGH